MNASQAQKLKAPQVQNSTMHTWCMGQLVYIANCTGKSPIVEKLCKLLPNFKQKFPPQMSREFVSCADFEASQADAV